MDNSVQKRTTVCNVNASTTQFLHNSSTIWNYGTILHQLGTILHQWNKIQWNTILHKLKKQILFLGISTGLEFFIFSIHHTDCTYFLSMTQVVPILYPWPIRIQLLFISQILFQRIREGLWIILFSSFLGSSFPRFLLSSSFPHFYT